MGAWGAGVYQNDNALDYISKLSRMAQSEVRNADDALVFIDMFWENGTFDYPESEKLYAFLDYEMERIEDWKESSQAARLLVLEEARNKLNNTFIYHPREGHISDEELETMGDEAYQQWYDRIVEGKGSLYHYYASIKKENDKV